MSGLSRGNTLDILLRRLRARYRGPYMLYDLNEIRQSALGLADIGRAHGIRFLCAVKALPTEDLLLAGMHTGGGVDISNQGELLRLCAHDNERRGPISYGSLTGPAMKCGLENTTPIFNLLTVNVERSEQLRDVNQFVHWTDRLEVGARVAVNLHGSPSSRPLRFGFDERDISGLREVGQHPLFGALHCHLGANAVAAGAPMPVAARLLEIARETGMQLRRINLGGGFRLENAAEIQNLCERLRRLVPIETEIVFEPGAWLTERAGFALCKVLTSTYRSDIEATLVTVDLSRTSHIPWSNARLLAWWGRRPIGKRIFLFGPTCHEGDYLCEADLQTFPAFEEEEQSWALLAGITGYDPAFNVDFNGIEKAAVLGFN